MSTRGYPKGESHHRAKASNAIVEQARQLRDRNLSYLQIARILGYSKWTVRDWCDYRTRTRL